VKPNYAINPTPELALRSDRAVLPARVIAALDPMKFLAFLVILCSVSACDTVRGVTRASDSFGSPPETNCVVEAVRSIKGISNVTYERELGGRPLTAHGIETPDVVHRYWYEYEGLRNNFYFTVKYDGTAELVHGYVCLNCTPPQEEIDKIYPAILAIEDALEANCSLEGLRSNVREYCVGVRCGGV
jgi:hypothetical protein